MSVRTRFAPSPTGFLHVGSLRTAIFAWLYARQHGGKFILRIEDTDKAREVEGAIGHIMESLKWLNVSWDEGTDVGGPFEPYLQSARVDIHTEFARTLLAQGNAYPDPYTEAEVEAFRKKAEEEKRPFLFRDHRPESIMEWDGKAPLRFKVPEIKRYEWNDVIMGDLSAGEEALDDFILIKSDGYPTYNFAHVVDDITMQVTHVMRGQEFISSTPKFLSLYDALGVTPPVFATLPPILGESGTKKLSKRDGAKDVLEYRTEGYLPQAFLNFLILLGWHPSDDTEILSYEDLLHSFDLSRVQRSGAQFNEEKLLHINREWMRTLSDDEYLNQGGFDGFDRDRVRLALPLLKERAHTFAEAREMLEGELSCLFSTPTLSKYELIAKEVLPGSTSSHLSSLRTLLSDLHEGVAVEYVKTALMPYANSVSKEDGGRGAVLWPLRYALSGQERSPDPFTLISILGKSETISRIDTAIGILGE